jgi:predicted methyltransferase
MMLQTNSREKLMRTKSSWMLALLLSIPWVAHAATPDSKAPDSKVVAAAIASTDRLAADRDQDEWRKPKVVLEFLGAKPGMQVIDVFAAGGYYSELLSRTVGPKGHVIAYNNPGYAKFAEKGMKAHFDDHRLANVDALTTDIEKLSLKPASLDAALFVMSYHDLYWRPTDGSWPATDPDLLLKKIYAAVKPGGTVVVLDHVAEAGSEPHKSVNDFHRIDPAVISKDFARAGFKPDGESQAFRNPADKHAKEVFDPSIQHHTDQVLLRFVK